MHRFRPLEELGASRVERGNGESWSASPPQEPPRFHGRPPRCPPPRTTSSTYAASVGSFLDASSRPPSFSEPPPGLAADDAATRRRALFGDGSSSSSLSLRCATTSASPVSTPKPAHGHHHPSAPPPAPTLATTRATTTMTAATLALPPPRFPETPLPLLQFVPYVLQGGRTATVEPASDDDAVATRWASISTASLSASSTPSPRNITVPAITPVTIRRTIPRAEALKRLEALRRRGLLPPAPPQ